MTKQERVDRYAAKQRRAAARRPHRETDHAGKRREKMAAHRMKAAFRAWGNR